MIYTKTALGQSALQDRSLGLTPRQRSAFIMFDGKRSTADVIKATAGLGVTGDDVSRLVELGLLAASSGAAAAVAATAPQADISLEPSASGVPSLNSQAHYLRAYPIATRLTANLGLRGFRLNLAVEAAIDLVKLKELAPRIKEAVGPEKFKELENALYD